MVDTDTLLYEARRIAFTGGIYAHSSGARISRKTIEQMITDIGKIAVSDASKADVLVLGDIRGNTTRKLESATANSIPVISGRDFIETYHKIFQ